MASTQETDSADAEYEETFGSHLRSDGSIGEETSACQSCRKKKSKCSRQQPCSQCVKSEVDCVYEDRRLKGGIKTGVVERINQRIDALESMFLGQGIFLQQFLQDAAGSRAASLLQPQRAGGIGGPASLTSYTDRLRQTFSSLATGTVEETAEEDIVSPAATNKRRRESEQFVPSKRQPLGLSAQSNEDLCYITPLPKEIDDVLTAYFKFVHPWVPVLHPATFVRRARDAARSEGVSLILSAIVAVAAKHHPNPENSDQLVDLSDYAQSCRQRVIATAMESNTIEAVQALLLIAFDTISRGKGSSPWSLVSLITRKVQDLQLNAECAPPSDSCAEFFSTAAPGLQPATTWLEIEERRRIFWLSFLMDRFCSIATSTHPNIASRSIRLRLPCDGCMWESDQAVETSYFKMDDQSQNETAASDEPSPFPPPYATKEGPNGVGGLAYTIEATESLSLITKFNIRHSLEPENAGRLSAWLNRFRQLDSRLLQWELCLTHRWRDVRVVNGYIDPNLTLAHMTHNAAIILLHRRLAHPPPQSRAWLSGLVSAASREACVMAAMKIDKISRRYLAVSDGIAPHQFAFCLFVAGKVLLAQASYHSVRPPDEVRSIISSLKEVSRRLSSNLHEGDAYPESPADKLAKALLEEQDQASPSHQVNKAQQPTPPFADFNQISSMGDFPSVLQHCATSPSSGISPGGLIQFGQDATTTIEENVMDLAQSTYPGTRMGAAWQVSTPRQPGSDGESFVVGSGERDFDFFAELRRLEYRAKEHERGAIKDMGTVQRRNGNNNQ